MEALLLRVTLPADTTLVQLAVCLHIVTLHTVTLCVHTSTHGTAVASATLSVTFSIIVEYAQSAHLVSLLSTASHSSLGAHSDLAAMPLQ